jgi:hypothetical protein
MKLVTTHPFIGSHQGLLFVEDETTAVYLSSLWDDRMPKMEIRTAGSCDAVSHLARYYQKLDPFTTCLGIRDRDFRDVSPDNAGIIPENGIYTLIRHEIENYWLDPELLAKCEVINSWQRTPQEIRNKIDQTIAELFWWYVGCAAIAEIHETLHQGFPNNPVESVSSRDDVFQHIVNSPWFTDGKARELFSVERIEDVVTRHFVVASERFSHVDKEYLLFPGKEIWKRIKGFLLKPNTLSDHDTIRQIGRFQAEMKDIPLELLTLRDNLILLNL